MKRISLVGLVTLLLLMVATVTNAGVSITDQGGWFESAYVEFTPDGSSYYNVYYSTSSTGSWTKIDDQLVRKYSSSKGRADVLGLSAGTYYIKVASVNANGTETASTVSDALTVKAHDRAGFAHFNHANQIGAYNDNGTLKSGTNILYITKSNAKTITMTVPSASNKTAIYTGLQTIINAWTKAYSSGWSSAPLDIRVLGTLSADDMDAFSSSAEGIQIKGASAYASCPITFEGVGDDAVIHGFGFLIRNTSDLEMRNFAIMHCMDDGVSLDTNNSHVWVHNLDLFYGNAGGDKDQAKGDGTVDLKGDSKDITISYNHFWDSGKSSLCGMKSENASSHITYHHNWFDHSDSRHPRIRTMSVHVYNNYFDGVSKYGTGVTMGASCFVDRNYFRSCKYPMMSSMQGSDVYAGSQTRNPDANGTFSGENSGIIKSYGNYMTGNCTYITYGASTYLLHGAETAKGNIDTTIDYDAYEVSSPSQTVPSSVTGYQGGSTYNNFDTGSGMYSYTADDASAVPDKVTGTYGAGRLQHGTYQYTFSESDDTNYGVISALKSDVEGYKSTSYYTPVTNAMYFKDGVITDSAVDGGEEEDPSEPTASDDATLKSLTVSGYSLSFSSSTTYYSVTLNYGTETAPTVSASTNNANATAVITQATSTTGMATVTVTAANGTTKKIYQVQFSVAAEPVEPTPEGSIISTALTLNIGDGSNAYKGYLTGTYNTSTSCNATYNYVTNNSLAIKMESSTSISFTTTKAFTMTFVADGSQTASFKIDGTTVAASSGNTASVDVAAGTHTLTKSGAIKMCFLDFADVASEPEPEPELSSDATLSSLTVEGYSLDPAFTSSNLTYAVVLTAGSTTVPTITATTTHTNASYDVDTENCHPAGQAIIDVTAEDGTSGKYYINITVAPTIYTVSASAGAGGTASVSPSGSVEEGTSVTFTATANEGYKFSKWSNNSTVNPYTTTVSGDLALTATFEENTSESETSSFFSAVATNVMTVAASTTNQEITSANAAITGGSMYVSSAQSTAKDLIIDHNGKVAFCMTNNNTFFKVTLSKALQAGDQIHGIVFTRTDAEQGLWFSTASSRPGSAPTANMTVAATGEGGATVWTSLPTYTVAEGDGICGETTFYIYRSVGKTVCFTDFTITREESTASTLSLIDGENYTISEDKIYADGVTYTKNFTHTNWNALYVPFAINIADYTADFDFAEIYAVCPVKDTNKDGEINADDDVYLISYNKTSGTTKPNLPYMIRAKATGSHDISAVDGKVYAATNGSITCTTTKAEYNFIGTYTPVTVSAENGYWYMSVNGNVSYMTSGSATLKSNRWYMTTTNINGYSSATNNQNSIDILFVGEDIDYPTAIEAVKQSKGQQTSDAIYNIAGQRVNSVTKSGLYIKNRKVIINQ